MANPEHVKILEQGVEVWNQWRKENPDIRPDLSGAYFSSTYLRNANLNSADLGRANLSNADLSLTDLSNAYLRGINLSNAYLVGTNSSGAYLNKANLSNANLSNANLSNANLSTANLGDANLSSANLRSTNFRGANFSSTDLRGADLRGADLSSADLSSADLSNADLSNANLRDTNLSIANLSGLDLKDADFSSANLSSADLSSADLRGADLSSADLRGADLSSADLNGSHLYLSLRDYWNINGVKCDHVYWDINGKERTPKDRDFLPSEFEELYKWRPLDDFEKLIRRAIEFPAEYKQAGTSILNYFSEILYKKYPEANATVQIKQDGLKVTMIVDPVDGEREIIEKVLNEYGLVVTGKMTPEAFTDDRFLIMDLQNQLTFAKAQIENQARMLQFQNEDIKKKDIRIDRFLDIMESAMQRPENIHINNVNGSDVGIIGDKAKSEGGIHFNNNED